MNDYTAKLKQEVTNPNKAFNHTTSRASTSKAKTINSSQDIESFLSLILDLIKTNEINAQKEIKQLKNETLKKKLLELNKQFNYFKYRVKKLQYFKDYLQILFKSVIKDDLVKPSSNDYKYETGLIEPKLLESVVRITNNSKILVSVIEGRKLKVEEYYLFGTENLIKYVAKINQKYSPLKINPTINEHQLYEQFMKLSKGTFNMLNTKMHFYCKQKATLDLLSSINTQILQSQQKVKYQCTNNNLVYQRRDHIKNLGLSRQKVQKKPQYIYLKQDQNSESSRNNLQLRNIIDQLRKESHQLTDKNQRLTKQNKSKQQNLKDIQAIEMMNQQNKRLSVQINKVKASNKHQLQQIGYLQFEDIQKLNKKIDQQNLMIQRLQKQHIENLCQINKLKQTIQENKKEIAQNQKCLSQERKERKMQIQSMNKLSQQKDILVKEKGVFQVRYNLILKQIKKIKLQQQQQIKNKQRIENVKKNQQSKAINNDRKRLQSQISSLKENLQHQNKKKIQITGLQQPQQTGIFDRLKEWLTNIPNEISKLVEGWNQKPADLIINIKQILNKRIDLVNQYERNAQNSLLQIQQQIKIKQQQRRKQILQNKGKSRQQIEKLLREENRKLKSIIEGLNIKINLLESRQETSIEKQNLKRLIKDQQSIVKQLKQNLFRQKQLLTKKEQQIKLNNDKIIQLSKQLAQRQGTIQRLVKTNKNDKNIIVKNQIEKKEKMEMIQGMSKLIEEKTLIYEKLQRQFIQTNIFVRDTLHNFEQAIKSMNNQTAQNRQEKDKYLKRNEMNQILRNINNNSDNYKMIINLNLKLDQIIQIFQKKVQQQFKLKLELNQIVKKSQFSNKTENKQRENPAVIQLLKLIEQLQQSNKNLQQSLINCKDSQLIHKQFNDNNYRRQALFQTYSLFHSNIQNIYQRIKNYRQLINNERLIQQDKQIRQFNPQNSPRLTRLKYCMQSYLTQFANEPLPDKDILQSQGDPEYIGKIQDLLYDPMLNQ